MNTTERPWRIGDTCVSNAQLQFEKHLITGPRHGTCHGSDAYELSESQRSDRPYSCAYLKPIFRSPRSEPGSCALRYYPHTLIVHNRTTGKEIQFCKFETTQGKVIRFIAHRFDWMFSPTFPCSFVRPHFALSESSLWMLRFLISTCSPDTPHIMLPSGTNKRLDSSFATARGAGLTLTPPRGQVDARKRWRNEPFSGFVPSIIALFRSHVDLMVFFD